MPKRMYEFQCSVGTVSEKFIDTETKIVECECCGGDANRIISSPSVMLDGCDPGFPGAWHRWEAKRNERLKQEQKQNS